MIKKILLTSCLVYFVSAPLLQAQTSSDSWTYIEIDSTKQMWGDWAKPEWLRYFGLDAGDIDRDGDLDILSGRYLYHNPGDNMESDWERTVLDDNVDGILCFDVDGDPYADLIAMALPDLFWYEALNTEATAFSRKRIGTVPATSHVNSQGFEKAQFIEGGPMEFVIAGNGNIYIVVVPENDNKDQEWEVRLICENTSDEGIGVGDIDADGDLDIAAGRRPDGEEEPKYLIWYENPGRIDRPWKETHIGESEHPIDRVEIADVNGDGKADVIVTEERYPGLEPDANLWWYGQQTLQSWERNRIATQYSSNNLDIADIDQDGDIDLLSAEHKGEKLELQLWYNDGKGSFSKKVIDTGKENHLGTQWVDIDLDGDLDIIGAGWDRHQYIHLWRNDKTKPLKTGMRFKDYPWAPERVNDEGRFLRVGGKLDYKSNEDHFPKDAHENGFIKLPAEVNLQDALRAEVFVERVQSHEDTKELRIQFNKGVPLLLPEPGTIPARATDYMFHFNSRIALSLSQLKQGQNAFRLTVSEEQSWDWPQNIIYGLVLRVYYPEDRIVPVLKSSGISSEGQIKDVIDLEIEPLQGIETARVDYIGFYEDVNWKGDGKYLDWQYRYHRGQLANHIGSATKPPFKFKWNTSWLPDQLDPIKIMALVKDINGITRVSTVLEGSMIDRTKSVSLIKPYGQDAFWTTRNGVHTEYLDLPFELQTENEVKLFWNSWSPCYSAGLNINGNSLPTAANTPCYDAFLSEQEIEDISSLKEGKNEISSAKTPLHEGKMVHGMDVQWPGIMMKIRRNATPVTNVMIHELLYEGTPHFRVETAKATYYFDRAGGGFSRIIDIYGNDWVSFKREPWGSYPASAASAFRGLPNLVFKSETDDGAGHPGHDRCNSQLVGTNKIRTVSKSGLWEWEWTFYDDHAIFEILKADPNVAYWFLYEGTPGGVYDPETSIYGTNRDGPAEDIPDYYKGSIDFGQFDWAYFGRKGTENSFYIAQLSDDDKMDMMSYLGNTENGALSEDGMTVFGFGREDNAQALLKGLNTFLIGFYGAHVNSKDGHQQITLHIENSIRTAKDEITDKL
ncbi:FG-GAP repeat domain-containing protein [Poritiphilus flavus]|uniref:VCBS repeat-containing protein n=1 Tax=Poritiphilus flavus TaxID=2697053 RepID=A0A6L9ECD7_9FLAO|nr:VCBS repeat-containing protein [Poritiphilus flavus]NAS12312.1 hypothetical protein [Poritiphilus flavus]